MKPDRDFLTEYAARTPLALAIERSIECRILARQRFERPILDIGCGDGIFAGILFDAPPETGIDPNPVEIDHARRLGSHRELIECFGNAIPRPDAGYRTVFSNSVLEHIPDLEPVLKEAIRLLVPGGVFYATVPTDRFEQYALISRILAGLSLDEATLKFRRFYNRFWAHHHCYAPDDWAALFRKAGFVDVVTQTYDPRNICTLNDTLAPLGAPAFVLKRLLNKWTLFPQLRRALFAVVAPLLRRLLTDADSTAEGGLVFIAARRPA